MALQACKVSGALEKRPPGLSQLVRPSQKKLTYQINIRIYNNASNSDTFLECKDYVKFLGVRIDKNLTWKYHIDYIASKISRVVGIISRLRHSVPLNTLIQIYRSLTFPYTYYGIAAWGQAQICLSRCCIMHIANSEDTRFENQSLATTSTRQKLHSLGVGGNYCLYANQHRARVYCVRFHRKLLTLDGLFETPRKATNAFGYFKIRKS